MRSRPSRPRRPVSTEESELFTQALQELDELDPDGLERIKGREERAAASHAARFSKRVHRALVEPQERLDLHGLDRQAAHREILAFLAASRRHGHDCVLIIHGKGERVLAREVHRTLDASTAVAEHVPAPRRLGGAGARVVRLRR